MLRRVLLSVLVIFSMFSFTGCGLFGGGDDPALTGGGSIAYTTTKTDGGYTYSPEALVSGSKFDNVEWYNDDIDFDILSSQKLSVSAVRSGITYIGTFKPDKGEGFHRVPITLVIALDQSEIQKPGTITIDQESQKVSF